MEQKIARPEDRLITIEAHKEGLVNVNLDMNGISTRNWAKEKGWPTPLFGFKKIFIRKILEDDENFTDALESAGIEVWIPGY
ncbi:MAG: hypothetical protein ABIR18_05260 [Chitinophagaceae bacterium]